MNSINWLDIIPFGEAIGWTVLQSIWQVGLIAIVVRLILFAIPPKYSNARYSILLLSLLAAVVWVSITFHQEQSKLQAATAIETAASLSTIEFQTSVTAIYSSEKSQEITQLTTTEHSTLPLSVDAILSQFTPYIPLLTIGWCIGVLLLSIYLLFGFIHLHHLRTRHLLEVEEEWEFLFTQLKQQMGIFRKVQFAISGKVNEPVTFHFFKPVVLVPMSFFSGLTPEQVEVVLLHELAHIRRHDYLFNTLQSIVEILFFYHPAIWWMSSKIREEREHCCDDLVLKVRNNPMLYAEALTRLQIFHQPLKFRLAMSLNGKNGAFKQRIFRLFGQYERPNSFMKSGLLGVLLIAGLLTQAFVQSDAPEQIKEAFEQLSEQEELVEQISSIESSDTVTTFPDKVTKPMLNDVERTDDDSTIVINYTGPSNCHELTEAVRKEAVEQVKELLKVVDPNCIDPNPGYEVFEVNGDTWKRRKARTPLTAAARSGNLEIAKLLIEANADLDFSPPNDATPLLAAAEYGTLEMVKYFVSIGADVNEQNFSQEGTPLVGAARGGNLDIVKYLFAEGADINSETKGEGTPLSVAARSGYLEVVKFLIAEGADINSNTRGEGTPLTVAARSGHLEIVKYLLGKGADINSEVVGEGTPLSVAARSGHMEVVEYLLAQEANINAEVRGEGTPLSVAARSGHTEVVNLLLEKGANINADARGEGTPLSVAARSGHLDVVQLLLKKGANINADSYGEGTPLTVAARSGHLEVVDFLLTQGAAINAEARGEGTPLTIAARSGHLDVVKLLVEKGAAINAEARGEGTPIAVAARSGHKEIVQYLLSKGADINAGTQGEGTPLSVAARSGHEEVAAFLIQEGATPNEETRGEGAAISVAARSGHLSVVKLLLEQQADIYANTRGESTPLSVAARSGHLEVVKFLISEGADVESKARGEGTPLTVAARSGNLDIVDFLLEKGADLYSNTRGEGTPLSIAARSGHLDIVKFLLSKGADINSKVKGEGSPLFVAMRSGHDQIARYLVQQGAGEEIFGDKRTLEAQGTLPKGVSLSVASPIEDRLEVTIKANKQVRMLVEVRTLDGQLVEQLLDAGVSGKFTSDWKPDQRTGTYFLKIIVEGQDLSRKIGAGTAYPWN